MAMPSEDGLISWVLARRLKESGSSRIATRLAGVSENRQPGRVRGAASCSRPGGKLGVSRAAEACAGAGRKMNPMMSA